MIKDIGDDIVKITGDIYDHTKELFKQGKITISEFNEFGVIIENLCEYLSSEVENILQGAIEEVKKVVKTFIDKELMDKVIAAEEAAKVAIEKAQAEAEAKAKAQIKVEETIKNSVLALITVMGAESIAKTLNISIEKVEKIINKK